jgi:high-affinity Fe2+/Pb2+ permease
MKEIRVISVASVILTILVWFLARKIMPPAFDAKETALLFFVCFLLTYVVSWAAMKLRKGK